MKCVVRALMLIASVIEPEKLHVCQSSAATRIIHLPLNSHQSEMRDARQSQFGDGDATHASKVWRPLPPEGGAAAVGARDRGTKSGYTIRGVGNDPTVRTWEMIVRDRLNQIVGSKVRVMHAVASDERQLGGPASCNDRRATFLGRRDSRRAHAPRKPSVGRFVCGDGCGARWADARGNWPAQRH